MRGRKWRGCLGIFVLTAALWCLAVPVMAGPDTEEAVDVEPGSTTEMEPDQTYQISSPAETMTSYIFKFTPQEDGGYYLEYDGDINGYELGLEYYVTDGEENLLAGGNGSGYYMLKAGETYVFDMDAIPNYRGAAAAGQLTMTKEYDWNECVYVDGNQIATGLAQNFKILYLPDGVRGMKDNSYVYGIYTLILPDSIQDPVDHMDFWTASYRYETAGTSGRYLAEDGVLYDQKDRILRYVPPVREGSYTVKDGTKEIGSSAFEGTNLEEVIFPDSVETLSSFGKSETLKRIKLPADAYGMSAEAFQSLYALESLEVSEASERYESRDGVLFSDNSDGTWTLEFYPIGKEGLSYTIPEDVSWLASGSFAQSGTEDEAVRNLKYLTIPETVINLNGFLQAGNGYSVYTELTLRGHEGSAAHQYYLENFIFSDQIKWETIGEDGEDEKRDFTLKVDNNSFQHLGVGTKESGFWGTDGIELTDEDYQKLFRHEMEDGVRDYLRNYINGDVKWKGSCHGIATVIGRVFNQDMTVAEVSDSGRSCVYDLDQPYEDQEYLSAISYYQLMQYVDDPGIHELASVYHKRPGMIGSLLDFLKGTDSGEMSSPAEFENFFDTMRSSLDEGKILLLRSPSHTVLVTGYETTNQGYTFQIYDENSVNSEHPEGELYEWKVSKDFMKFSCAGFFTHDGEPFNEKTFGWLSILLPSETDQGHMAEPKEDVTDILIDAMDRFTIRDSKGNTLKSDGKQEVEATMEVEELQTINSTLGDDAQGSLECKFTVPDEETYQISDLGEEAGISLYNDKGYLSLRGTGIRSAKMTPGEGIEIQGEKGGSFTAVIDTDEKVAENETGLISVSGTVKGDGAIKIQTSGETVTINSENDIEDLKLESFVENEALPLKIENSQGGDNLKAGETVAVKATDFGKQDDSNDPNGDETNSGDAGSNNPGKGNPSEENHTPDTGDVRAGRYLYGFLISGMVICGTIYLKKRVQWKQR